MKCTNKITLLCPVFVLFFLVMEAGCKTAPELTEPYSAYETGISVGTGGDGEYSLFAEELCVAEDTELGVDETTSYVAEGAGVFNLATNQVTYEKNIYEKHYPASTTKILTAYLALKYCGDLDKKVTVSENAVNQEPDSSVCGLMAGDVISVRDLLYGMMLKSGNDAAIAIAEEVSGSVDEFVGLMNREAAAFGATQSHFMNPNGLPDEEHYTSVYDLYLIFRQALMQDGFLSLIQTPSYDAVYADAAGNPVEKTWENTNQYFTGYAEIPDGITILGGKTGTTGAAGYCLAIYALNAKNEPMIAIIMKADGKADLYMLMNEILLYGSN